MTIVLCYAFTTSQVSIYVFYKYYNYQVYPHFVDGGRGAQRHEDTYLGEMADKWSARLFLRPTTLQPLRVSENPEAGIQRMGGGAAGPRTPPHLPGSAYPCQGDGILDSVTGSRNYTALMRSPSTFQKCGSLHTLSIGLNISRWPKD